MPKRPLFPAMAVPSSFNRPKPKPKGFDPGSLKGPKLLQGARLAMRKNMLPGKSGQR